MIGYQVLLARAGFENLDLRSLRDIDPSMRNTVRLLETRETLAEANAFAMQYAPSPKEEPTRLPDRTVVATMGGDIAIVYWRDVNGNLKCATPPPPAAPVPLAYPKLEAWFFAESRDAETWKGPFDTREQALQAAYALHEDAIVWVGTAARVTLRDALDNYHRDHVEWMVGNINEWMQDIDLAGDENLISVRNAEVAARELVEWGERNLVIREYWLPIGDPTAFRRVVATEVKS